MAVPVVGKRLHCDCAVTDDMLQAMRWEAMLQCKQSLMFQTRYPFMKALCESAIKLLFSSRYRLHGLVAGACLAVAVVLAADLAAYVFMAMPCATGACAGAGME